MDIFLTVLNRDESTEKVLRRRHGVFHTINTLCNVLLSYVTSCIRDTLSSNIKLDLMKYGH